MKLTIWQPKSPGTVDELKSNFARKIGAFRTATGRPERFVTRCACAVHDKGFTAVYERTDPARPFILTGIYKDGEGDATGVAGTERSRTLPASEVDHTGWRCPYCLNDRQINCDECRSTVCGGKTHRYPGTGDIFTCRDSCGARGALIDATTVKGVEPSGKAAGRKPNADADRFPAPGLDTRRLGTTKPPRLK